MAAHTLYTYGVEYSLQSGERPMVDAAYRACGLFKRLRYLLKTKDIIIPQ